MEPRSAIIVATALALSLPVPQLSAQAPPPETLRHVLMDVGPLPVPAVCGCATAPFTVLPPRPGWGYGSGPAAPDTAAPPARFERRLQKERDAEDVANVQHYMQDAFEGNPHAALTLGLILTSGTAVQRDDEAAGRWFRLAARHEHRDAYVQLGHRYIHGVGLPANDKAAAYWFYMGASNGDIAAMIALGSLYAAGRGVDQDWSGALYWWEKARHWRFVGDAYACGLGVEQDNERALAMYQKGADSGDMSSAIQVGHMHAGACTARPDDEAAVRAYKKTADDGYPEAQVGLSLLYLEGRGVAMSPYSAYMWARLAELRLEPGELRRLASSRVAAAARLLSAPEVEDAEQFVKSLIDTGTSPMNR
jgi:TPR repeat protein